MWRQWNETQRDKHNSGKQKGFPPHVPQNLYKQFQRQLKHQTACLTDSRQRLAVMSNWRSDKFIVLNLASNLQVKLALVSTSEVKNLPNSPLRKTCQKLLEGPQSHWSCVWNAFMPYISSTWRSTFCSAFDHLELSWVFVFLFAKDKLTTGVCIKDNNKFSWLTGWNRLDESEGFWNANWK